MALQQPKIPLKVDVRRRLRDDIVHGRLRPGEVLRDLDLAARYGVSTSPVREAIADLANERLIESSAHSVKRVAPLDRQRSLDFFEIFRVLALHGYALGVPRIGPAGIEGMAEVLAAAEADGGRSFSLFGEFHDAVFQASGNRELRRLLGLSYPWLQRLTILLIGRNAPLDAGLARARATLAALRAGDDDRVIGLFRAALDEFQLEIERMPEIY